MLSSSSGGRHQILSSGLSIVTAGLLSSGLSVRLEAERLSRGSPGACREGTMAVDTEELVRNVTRLLPPYRVLLHNDDYNTMDHVVRALVESVPKLSVREAGRIMLEAHLRGIAQVIVCPKEQA